MRIPKDIDRYIDSRIAAGRLMMTAVKHVLAVNDGVRIKWELKVRYYTPKESENPNAILICEGATFSSGKITEQVGKENTDVDAGEDRPDE